MSSQRRRDPADDTDETETISSGDRDDIKLKQDNQLSELWHSRLHSGSLAASTPTRRRTQPNPEVVHSLDELPEISSIAAVVALQRWWRRHSAGGQRVAKFQKLCRRHVLEFVRRRRTLHARSKLHAIVLQILFLSVFAFSILHNYAHDRLYRFTRAVTSQYLEAPFTSSESGTSKTFFDVTSTQELLEWLKEPFMSITYRDSTMNNRIIGGIRIGQLRVETFNCSSRVTPFFTTDNETFYCHGSSDGDFTLSIEMNNPIQAANGDLYTFKGLNDTDTDTERSALFSTMSVSSARYSLPAPAYSVILPRSNEAQAFSILTTLEKNDYIDAQTRAVMLDLGLYNAMLRHVIALRFLVELPASGGAITSLSAGVAPVTSSFLLDEDRSAISACNVIVMLFYAYFFLDEVLALAHSRSRQWQYQAVWQKSNLKKTDTHKLKLSSLRRHGTIARFFGLLCYVCTWLLRLIALVKRPTELPLDSDKFVSLRPYVETFRAAQLALGASVCLAWIELLLMLRVSLHVDLLVRAVVCAAPQLFVLAFMIALVVMGYASTCLLVLGAQSQLFQSLPESLRSLLAILLQTGTTGASSLLGYSSTSLEEVGHDAAGTSTLTTLLLGCFLLLNVFVAANLFLVVIYEGYLKAKREIEADQRSRKISSTRDDEDSIKAALMHLDLWHETAVYGRAVAAKFINLVPRALRRRKTAEQSTVLPSNMPRELPQEDESEDERYRDDVSSPQGKNYAQDSTCSKGSSRKRQHRRSSSSDSSSLLEGMVLQLALQNEVLLRAVNELKQDVQALQRSDQGTSDRDMLRRGVPNPTRVHKQQKTSTSPIRQMTNYRE
ncbi:hypothetical protein JG688_00005315 [Phytophthora aleatoria]|uniref:Polycystin cation channel PKD1/PKD2 domain-containing protein n=1 Tax=Phytophthora aleatoria TaxID=2496075 RepID=A0A8J5M8P0_9STRA|nr:hypothetical protein JG688_00005315 [Phytophthora aleatoria]